MNRPIPPFRKELRQFQKQHPLFRATHPFWHDCFRGRLERADVCRWAVDIYPIVRDFARLYVQVAAKCDSEQTLTFLAETIFEETGSGIEAESHPTLFRNFLAAFDVMEHDIPGASSTDAGQAVWNFCWQTVREGSFLDGLTLVGIGIERPLPDFFRMISRSFQRHYGAGPTATKFFDVHTVADVKHSQLASRIVSDLARTADEQNGVRRLLFELWDLQKQQLDELHQMSKR